MKFFIYKTLIVVFLLFLLFQFTVGSTIRSAKNYFYNLTTKENLEKVKNKIRKEIKKGNEKDTIFSKEDANLLKSFIIKIQNELELKD